MPEESFISFSKTRMEKARQSLRPNLKGQMCFDLSRVAESVARCIFISGSEENLNLVKEKAFIQARKKRGLKILTAGLNEVCKGDQ